MEFHSSSSEHEDANQEIPDDDSDVLFAEKILSAVFVGRLPAQNASLDARANLRSTDVKRLSLKHQSLSKFVIKKQIGQGTFGSVYEAFDLVMRRTVAIKVAHANVSNDPKVRLRFSQEMRLAAKLNHPGIVQIYEAGEDDGRVYFAMELCNGQTLSQWLSEQDQAVAIQTAASIICQAALAVEHGHWRGVVHRDLKPDNMMIDQNSQGEPKIRILDFGLAFGVEDSMRQTSSSAMIGTPLYMSPEQVDSDGFPIGPRSDIFALGAILYELLAGSSPFASDSLPQVLDKIRNENIVNPRKIRSDIPKDLDVICMKALRSRPDQRYETAAALAIDLESFLNDRPIHASSMTLLERTTNWLRRPDRIPEFGLGLIAINLLVLSWAALNYPLVMCLFPGSSTDAVSQQMFLPLVCLIIPCHGLMLWSSNRIYNRKLSRPVMSWHFSATILMAVVSISVICLTSNTSNMHLNRFERVAALGLMSTFAEVQAFTILLLLLFARFPKSSKTTA